MQLPFGTASLTIVLQAPQRCQKGPDAAWALNDEHRGLLCVLGWVALGAAIVGLTITRATEQIPIATYMAVTGAAQA